MLVTLLNSSLSPLEVFACDNNTTSMTPLQQAAQTLQYAAVHDVDKVVRYQAERGVILLQDIQQQLLTNFNVILPGNSGQICESLMSITANRDHSLLKF